MDYLELIKEGKVNEVLTEFEKKRPQFKTTKENASAQYNIEDHEIFSDTTRPDKTITKDTGRKKQDGVTPVTQTTTIKVARIGLPMQDEIVNGRIGFMLTNPVEIDPTFSSENNKAEEEVLALVDSIQNDNKMDYRNKEVARRLMSEMECAEIWYLVEDEEKVATSKFSLKVRIISPALGDELYPYFDAYGDMKAFGRKYKVKEDTAEIEHFDIYLPDQTYLFANRGEWKLEVIEGTPNPAPNIMGKIPVVYYQQPAPEWYKVQSMIERLETSISNHADTNDYFGSPILAVVGEILGYAQKGETGKILQLSKESKANYLSLASKPESVQMENDNLERFIHKMSQTINFTPDFIKGLGNISGIALKLLFFDAHIAVSNKEEIFGIGLQRRLNIIKAFIGKVLDKAKAKATTTLQLKPVITPYLPANINEEIDNLVNAVNGGIMSTETAIEQNPLVEDTETEKTRINEGINAELAGTRGTT